VSLWSLVGMIAVSGVVVNDNLVLVDYINRNREKGIALLESIREAGAARFRPIILTSLTTFGGLTPLMLETSLQAKFLVPMAVSLAFGVMFATVISLILVPATYYILNDIQGFLRQLSARVRMKDRPMVSATLNVDDLDDIGQTDAQKNHWHVGLDEAYEEGYKDGLAGVISRKAPYELEVIAASWEAGWDDGNEEYKQKQ